MCLQQNQIWQKLALLVLTAIAKTCTVLHAAIIKQQELVTITNSAIAKYQKLAQAVLTNKSRITYTVFIYSKSKIAELYFWQQQYSMNFQCLFFQKLKKRITETSLSELAALAKYQTLALLVLAATSK